MENVYQIRDYERSEPRGRIVRKAGVNHKAQRAFYMGKPDDLTQGRADPEMEYEAPSGDCA